MKPPKNPEQALTTALVLALSAETESDRNAVIALAEEIAAGLTEIQVARCKRRALEVFEKWEAA
jgi:hypothetical protein